jgi:predicted MFS family arabinose efflux permease
MVIQMTTTVGVGSVFRNTLGDELIRYFGYNASFLGLALVAVIAFLLLWLTVRETLPRVAEEEHRFSGMKFPTLLEKEFASQ